MYQTDNLSHKDALRILDAIRAEAEKNNSGIAAAIADAHGELMAFIRTDGCKLPPITIAMNKAFTAARERTETAALGERARAQGFPMTNFGDIRFTNWGGGVPIVHNGGVIGAVAVSGLTEDEDVALAKLGLSAL